MIENNASEPLLMVRFTKKSPPDLITFTKERLVDSGIVITTEEGGGLGRKDPGVVLGITTNQELLEMEAESIHLIKPTKPGKTWGKVGIMELFTVDDRDEFVNIENEPDQTFFSSAEQSMLVNVVLESVTVLKNGELSNNLSRKLEELGVPLHVSNSDSDGMIKSRGISIFSHDRLLHVLLEHNYVDVVCPLHGGHRSARKAITSDSFNFFTPLPIEKIRAYYGDGIALYFAWMDSFIYWLLIPGFVGLGIFFLRKYENAAHGWNRTVDDCIYTPFFGLVMFIWAILFLRFWNRRENLLAYKWGCFEGGGYGYNSFSAARPEFEGVMKRNEITGLMIKYYSPKLRMLKYIGSAIVTAFLLACAFSVMILSLNLQGYVNPAHDETRWEGKTHPFYFPRLADLAEEGQIFDMQDTIRSLIPVILHVSSVIVMNTCYRSVAEKLTDWENHQTYASHENSLILKRFLFEAFDAYLILFYLAFFECDIAKLRSELVSMFNIDVFRRVALTYVVPKILQLLQGNKEKADVGAAKKNDITPADIPDDLRMSNEANWDGYEQFDDYLEMVIELGYVTLFASAYPLAAIIAIMANQVEVRIVALKLSSVTRRPMPRRQGNIGTWNTVMTAIIWMSALTNCLIFGFSSMQMMQWFPSLYTIAEDGDQEYVAGKGDEAVFIIFAAERLLLLIGILIVMIIPIVPNDVLIKVEHRNYVNAEEARMSRIKSGVK